jgi:hypothetical protein
MLFPPSPGGGGNGGGMMPLPPPPPPSVSGGYAPPPPPGGGHPAYGGIPDTYGPSPTPRGDPYGGGGEYGGGGYGQGGGGGGPLLSARVGALAASGAPLVDVAGGDDAPAPALASALVARLGEFGVGLESCFHALNVSGNPAGVTALEMATALRATFKITCPESVAEKMVAWGDKAGSGRLR